MATSSSSGSSAYEYGYGYGSADMSLTDQAIENELQSSSSSGGEEVIMERCHGRPSWKQAATPLLVVTLVLIIMGLALTLMSLAAASENGDNEPVALGFVLPLWLFIGAIIMGMITRARSITHHRWFVAVTSHRVIAIRRGGYCSSSATEVVTSIPFHDIVQLQSDVSPPGLCYAPGPFVAIHTRASLAARRGGTRVSPALSIAMIDGRTITRLRSVIETARAAIPGIPPLLLSTPTPTIRRGGSSTGYQQL